MISTDLVNSIYHHARLTERAIGVDFDSDKVNALYGFLTELTLQETAQKNLKVELVFQLDQIQELIAKEKENGAEFDNVLKIAKSSELAIAMMDVLNG